MGQWGLLSSRITGDRSGRWAVPVWPPKTIHFTRGPDPMLLQSNQRLGDPIQLSPVSSHARRLSVSAPHSGALCISGVRGRWKNP